MLHYHVSEGLVACEERGRDKSQARVFHAAVRERRREAQQIVAAPPVRPREGLRSLLLFVYT